MMANKNQINQFITELAIYKICSLLKIGPAAETQIGFDIICYNDCMQFQIELCLTIQSVNKIKFQKQTKQCLFDLHYFRIIHKDIKTNNILFSPIYNKYVLADFGISHPIAQNIGYRTLTYCEGTQAFMSQQMKRLLSNSSQADFVDLYWNDVYSLSVVLENINKENLDKIDDRQKQFKQMYEQKYKKIQTDYVYEYLKLKYYCIKLDGRMEQVQINWNYMNRSRQKQLIQIIEKSMEYQKIKNVYNYLANLKEYKYYDLSKLKKQAQSIGLLQIIFDEKQVTFLKLKNTLRVYGYSTQTKEMIIKLKKQKLYKKTIKIIDKIINQDKYNNYRNEIHGNNTKFIRIKARLQKCQKQKQQRGIFHNCIILLKQSDKLNIDKKQILQKLQNLKYERTKVEQIEQSIIINYIDYNKQNAKIFIDQLQVQKQFKDFIIQDLQLNRFVASICLNMGKYSLAHNYISKQLDKNLASYGQTHPLTAQSYLDFGFFHKQTQNNYLSLKCFKKGLEIMQLFQEQKSPIITMIYQQIGKIYGQKYKFKVSLTYFIKSLKFYIIFGKQQSIARSYINISNIYEHIGEYDTALEYLNKVKQSYRKIHGDKNMIMALIYNNIASIQKSKGNFQNALEYFSECLKINLMFFIQQNPFISSLMNSIGILYDNLGQYSQALEYYNRSITINKQIEKQGVILTTTNCTMAKIYYNAGNYDLMLSYLIKSLDICKKSYGKQHPAISVLYNKISICYYLKSQFKKAFDFSSKSIKLQLKFHNEKHQSIGIRYNNMGLIYNSMSKYTEAIDCIKKSLQIEYKLYGKNQHPNIARRYNTLATIYKNLGRYQDALSYYHKSINIDKFFLMQSPSIAITYNNLGLLYDKMGKYQQALDMYHKSQTITKSIYGQNHHTLAIKYNNIGLLYINMGQYDTGTKYLLKSLDIDIKTHGQQYPSIAITYNNLGLVYQKMKKYKKALQYYQKSLNMDKIYYGLQHPIIVTTYNNIGSVVSLLNKNFLAHKYCSKSLKVRIKFYGNIHPDLCSNYYLLSKIYLTKKKYNRSIRYLYIALDIFLRFNNLYHPELPSYLSFLAKIYFHINKFWISDYMYRLSDHILLRYFPIDNNDVKQVKYMINLIESKYSFTICHYSSNTQFINNIIDRYKILSSYQLLHLLLKNKRQLKLEHHFKRNTIQNLKCQLEILLCYKYKYLGQHKQYLKVLESIKQGFEQIKGQQSKSAFRYIVLGSIDT